MGHGGSGGGGTDRGRGGRRPGRGGGLSGVFALDMIKRMGDKHPKRDDANQRKVDPEEKHTETVAKRAREYRRFSSRPRRGRGRSRSRGRGHGPPLRLAQAQKVFVRKLM